MKTLEDVFASEFKQSVSGVGYKDIYRIPLPPECETWRVSGTELYKVSGISESEVPYCMLNNAIVRQLPSGTVAKRRAIDKATRSFKRDDNGKFVYEDYVVPAGSIVVLSSVQINVLFKEYKYATKTGYGYIDFVTDEYGKSFMYVLPKSVLYKINQTALAVSVKNMKNYSGSGYVTWDNGVIYLHVIPYNPRSQYIGSKILVTKYSLDYRREVSQILQYWQRVGILPDLRLCVMSDGTNIALKQTAVGYSEYIPVDTLAVGDKEIYGCSSEGSDDGSGEDGGSV